MRIAIGSDHAGHALKAHLVPFLRAAGHDVHDAGSDDATAVDYPAYCAAVARAVAAGDVDRGIVIGGSGQGEQLAANAVRGIRAALGNDLWTARLSRQHNDANVLSLGGRIIGEGLAEEIVTLWLATAFEGDRHTRRVEQLAEIASLAADPEAQDELIDRLAPGALARARGASPT